MTHDKLSVRAALLIVFGTVLTAAVAGVSAAADDVRLIDAAKQNDQFVVRTLLEEGLDVNARHPDGSTALLWATYYDDTETAGLLISAGADVNAANDYGESRSRWDANTRTWRSSTRSSTRAPIRTR